MTHQVSIIILCITSLFAFGCDKSSNTPTSASGIQQASVEIPMNKDGLSAEQQNVKDRLLEDNKPGSIKHLYVISAMSGQVIIYSTVRAKATSGGKRLSPRTVSDKTSGQYSNRHGVPVTVNGQSHLTTEVIQDDGTYGSSMQYLYWWDTRGVYHQHYISGGQIVHISNQPLAVKSIIINMELAKDDSDSVSASKPAAEKKPTK